jgi:hypothetical protein
MFINAACESLLGSKTSLNSKSGAVESGCTMDAETIKKWTNAKNMTTSENNGCGKRERERERERKQAMNHAVVC